MLVNLGWNSNLEVKYYDKVADELLKFAVINFKSRS